MFVFVCLSGYSMWADFNIDVSQIRWHFLTQTKFFLETVLCVSVTVLTGNSHAKISTL